MDPDWLVTDPRDYKLDLSKNTSSPESAPAPRPYLSVQFDCCKVYLRIYRSPDGRHYRGRCPRCGLAVNFVVGDGGTDARTFVVR